MTLRRGAVIGVFVLYAVVLFTFTHWPGLKVEGPVPRSDLWVHTAAFGLWAILGALPGFFGPACSNRNLACTWVAGVAYAALDEGLQAIPALHRHAAWDDYFADVVGITLAIAALWVLARLRCPASRAETPQGG